MSALKTFVNPIGWFYRPPIQTVRQKVLADHSFLLDYDWGIQDAFLALRPTLLNLFEEMSVLSPDKGLLSNPGSLYAVGGGAFTAGQRF